MKKHLPFSGNPHFQPTRITRPFPDILIGILLTSVVVLLSCNKNSEPYYTTLQEVSVNFCYKDGAISTLSFESGNKVYVFDSRNGIEQVQKLPKGVYTVALDKNNIIGNNLVTVAIEGQKYTQIRSGEVIQNVSLLNYYIVTKNF